MARPKRRTRRNPEPSPEPVVPVEPEREDIPPEVPTEPEPVVDPAGRVPAPEQPGKKKGK